MDPAFEFPILFRMWTSHTCIALYTYVVLAQGKKSAPAACLRIIFSDYGSGAIGCNPDDLRDCEPDRNGRAASCLDAESTKSVDDTSTKVDRRATR